VKQKYLAISLRTAVQTFLGPF